MMIINFYNQTSIYFLCGSLSVNEFYTYFIITIASNVQFNVSLSHGSRKKGLKNSPESYYGIGNYDKWILILSFWKYGFKLQLKF